MLVVSGRVDRPTVHFEAPPRATLDDQLAEFIPWFNQTQHDPTMDPLLRAAICHFWFVTLHPVDDGNGRLTRALTDPRCHRLTATASVCMPCQLLF